MSTLEYAARLFSCSGPFNRVTSIENVLCFAYQGGHQLSRLVVPQEGCRLPSP
jgi:hypothetical protein